MRGHRGRGDPCRLSDRAHRRDNGTAVRPVRPRGCGVLRSVGLPAVARPRRSGPGSATDSADGALPTFPPGPHHARVPGGGRADPDPAARRQARSDGLADQPDADPDLCAVDAHRRADADVEPRRRGQLLYRAAYLRPAGPAAAGPRPDPGDPGPGRPQPAVGAHPVRRALGPEPVELAARVLLLVRGRHGARGAHRQPYRLAAAVGAQAGADGGHRGGGVHGGGVTARRSERAHAEHHRPVHLKTAMGAVSPARCWRLWCWTNPARRTASSAARLW